MLNTSKTKIEYKKARTSGFIHISEIIDDVMEDIAKRVLAAQRLNKKASIHIEHHKKRHSIYR